MERREYQNFRQTTHPPYHKHFWQLSQTLADESSIRIAVTLIRSISKKEKGYFAKNYQILTRERERVNAAIKNITIQRKRVIY